MDQLKPTAETCTQHASVHKLQTNSNLLVDSELKSSEGLKTIKEQKVKINWQISRKVVDMKTAPPMYGKYFYYSFSSQSSECKKDEGIYIKPVSLN